MKAKKDHTTRTLVLSIISLMLAVVCASACITVLSAYSSQTEPWRVVVLLIFPLLFLILGVIGLLRWRKKRIEGGKKPGKAVPIILVVVALLLIAQMAITLPAVSRTGKLNSALAPYVQDSYSSEDASLPENPWFVFYHDGNFSAPGSAYLRGTGSAAKVNVVVAYTEGTEKSGVWVEQGTGDVAGDALSQVVTVTVIRLEDWAVIDQQTFRQQLSQGENGVNPQGMGQIQRYLNALMAGEEDFDD